MLNPAYRQTTRSINRACKLVKFDSYKLENVKIIEHAFDGNVTTITLNSSLEIKKENLIGKYIEITYEITYEDLNFKKYRQKITDINICNNTIDFHLDISTFASAEGESNLFYGGSMV